MNSFLFHLLFPHPSVWGFVSRPRTRQGPGRLTLQNYSKSEYGLPVRGEKSEKTTDTITSVGFHDFSSNKSDRHHLVPAVMWIVEITP